MADKRNDLEGVVHGINQQDAQPLTLLGANLLGATQQMYGPHAQAFPGEQSRITPHKIQISESQLALIKKTIFRDATDEELALFKHICELRQLDPFARQIYARKQNQWNSTTKQYEKTMVVITGIDGFRLIAERSKKYAGQLGPFFTADGEKWLDAWVEDTPPKAVKVGVLRHDFTQPMWSMARFNAYCPHNDKGEPTGQWRTMPDGMIAKCAEALALRRAFPEELSGLYTTDEMQQAKQVEVEPSKEIRPIIDGEFAEVEEHQPLPTEGLLKDHPAHREHIKQRIHERFLELGITKQAQAKERYPEWPGNPDDIPMADLPKIAEAFGMSIRID